MDKMQDPVAPTPAAIPDGVAGAPTPGAGEAPAAVLGKHPLLAWREAQRMYGPRRDEIVQMTGVEAASRFGVSHVTWWKWERWPEEGGQIPTPDLMRRLSAFTGGAVTADSFYRIDPRSARRVA